jgi:hypothetical protein
LFLSLAFSSSSETSIVNNGRNTFGSVTNPINLSGDTAVNATYPAIASSGSHVYVAWSEGERGIKFRASSDNGMTWSPPLSSPARTISPNESTVYGKCQFPVIYSRGSVVYIAWSQAFKRLGLEIFEATSLDNGSTFRLKQLTFTSGMSNVTGGYITPAIAASGSNVYVVFSGNGTNSYVRSSFNYGLTWRAPRLYSHSLEVQVAASGNNAYAVADHTLAVTHDAGGKWTDVLSNSSFRGDEPQVAASGQYVYVASELPNGTGRSSTYIRAYASSDGGYKFTTVNDLSPTLNDSWAPMVGAFGSSAWISFREYPGGSKGEVWIYKTANGGKNWTGPISLSGKGQQGSAETFPYEVATTNGQSVFVGWSHRVGQSYWTFMVSASYNGGTTWSAPPGINLSHNKKGEAGFENDLAVGAISASGSNCYAVWQFELGDANQIYFATIS